MRNAFAEHVGGRAVSRADFQDVVAEIAVAQRPRNDEVAHRGAPLVAVADLVVAIHDVDRSIAIDGPWWVRPMPSWQCGPPQCSTTLPFAMRRIAVPLISTGSPDGSTP